MPSSPLADLAEAGAQVATALQHGDVPAAAGQLPGGDAAGGARSDDDGLAHRPPTSLGHEGVGQRGQHVELGLRLGARLGQRAQRVGDARPAVAGAGEDAVHQLGRAHRDHRRADQVLRDVGEGGRLGVGHLRGGEAARQHVTLEVGGGPADQVAVAAVLRGAVHELHGVGDDEVHQRPDRGVVLAHRGVASRAGGVGEPAGHARLQRGEAAAVGALVAGHLAVALQPATAPRAADPQLPRGPLVAVQGQELAEVVVLRAAAVGEGAAGVDPRRGDGERAEQRVDRDVAAGRHRSGHRVLGRARHDPVDEGPQRGELARR